VLYGVQFEFPTDLGSSKKDAVMNTLAVLFVGLVAAIHVYIVVLEAFLWTKHLGLRVFKLEPEFAARSASLAANQGLYNGFLAAGLLWGLVAADPVGFQFKAFFLGCVIVAGLVGAATVSKRILYVQTVPAAIALALVLAAR
jgi:putative membrane protein